MRQCKRSSAGRAGSHRLGPAGRRAGAGRAGHYIADGRTGFVCDTTSVEDLAKAIASAADLPLDTDAVGGPATDHRRPHPRAHPPPTSSPSTRPRSPASRMTFCSSCLTTPRTGTPCRHGQAWLDAGERVVVATGPVLRPLIARRIRMDRAALGSGSNPGVIRAADQPAGEDDHLRGFFAATTRGPVATLAYQASGRTRDLLWRPADVTAVSPPSSPGSSRPRSSPTISRRVTLALRALGASWRRSSRASRALPGPARSTASAGLAQQTQATQRRARPPAGRAAKRRRIVHAEFNDTWNGSGRERSPSPTPSPSSPAPCCTTTRAIARPRRRAHPGSFSAAASDPSRFPRPSHPAGRTATSADRVLSFGSFLSVRDDVLTVVVAGLRSLAFAGGAAGSADRADGTSRTAGSSAPSSPGRRPRPCRRRVCHAGNNTVHRGADAGVPSSRCRFHRPVRHRRRPRTHRPRRSRAPNELTPPEVASLVEAASPHAPRPQQPRRIPPRPTGTTQARAAPTAHGPDVHNARLTALNSFIWPPPRHGELDLVVSGSPLPLQAVGRDDFVACETARRHRTSRAAAPFAEIEGRCPSLVCTPHCDSPSAMSVAGPGCPCRYSPPAHPDG